LVRVSPRAAADGGGDAPRKPSVRAEGLGHGFADGRPVFTDIGFEHGPGAVVAVCGPSGSGKSTLLSILAGWEQPSSGSIVRAGIRSVSWVFQNPHGVPGRTARDHVVFPFLARRFRRREAERRAIDLLAEFGLSELGSKPFRALSGGEAQRLMLARAVASAPDLLLVDEPTAQLDRLTAIGVNATLGAVAESGAIVFVATHDSGTRDACTDVIELAGFQARTGPAQVRRVE
jgi:lipoprotein-releasing system ATP-binding protein